MTRADAAEPPERAAVDPSGRRRGSARNPGTHHERRGLARVFVEVAGSSPVWGAAGGDGSGPHGQIWVHRGIPGTRTQIVTASISPQPPATDTTRATTTAYQQRHTNNGNNSRKSDCGIRRDWGMNGNGSRFCSSSCNPPNPAIGFFCCCCGRWVSRYAYPGRGARTGQRFARIRPGGGSPGRRQEPRGSPESRDEPKSGQRARSRALPPLPTLDSNPRPAQCTATGRERDPGSRNSVTRSRTRPLTDARPFAHPPSRQPIGCHRGGTPIGPLRSRSRTRGSRPTFGTSRSGAGGRAGPRATARTPATSRACRPANADTDACPPSSTRPSPPSHP